MEAASSSQNYALGNGQEKDVDRHGESFTLLLHNTCYARFQLTNGCLRVASLMTSSKGDILSDERKVKDGSSVRSARLVKSLGIRRVFQQLARPLLSLSFTWSFTRPAPFVCPLHPRHHVETRDVPAGLHCAHTIFQCASSATMSPKASRHPQYGPFKRAVHIGSLRVETGERAAAEH